MVDAQTIYRQYKLLCAFKQAMAGYNDYNRRLLECGIVTADSAGAIRSLNKALSAIK